MVLRRTKWAPPALVESSHLPTEEALPCPSSRD